MVFAYLDESGIHGEAEACTVAGFFAKKGPWRKLESGWRSTLSRNGVPLGKFHATALLGKRKFFRDWDQDRRDALVMALAKVVADSGIRPISCGIFTSDFHKLSEKERRFVTGGTWTGSKFSSTGCPNKPYFLLFTECLKKVTGYTAAGQRAHFSCGLDSPSGGYARDVFAAYRERHSSEGKLGTIAFPLASETPRLQAADLFSNLAYRYMVQRKDTRNWITPPSDAIQLLLQRRKAEKDTQFHDTRSLRDTLAAIPNMD